MSDWPWKYFTRDELQCKCGCGQCLMDREFMRKFHAHRGFVDVPFIVHSGYRCPDYDEWIRVQAGQEGRGYHSGYDSSTGADSKGRAIDGHWEDMLRAWPYSMYHWHGGVGLYLKDRHADRFIHYDNGLQRVWTY